MLDVDGVLVDGRPEDGYPWHHRLYEDLGIAPCDLRKKFFAHEWQDVVVGKTGLIEALTASLARLPTTISAEDLVSYWFKMDSHIVDAVLSDCRLTRAQGIPVILATNQEHERARYLLKVMGLDSEVDGIVYSAQVGCQKPHPEFYIYAARATGFTPHELLLVDDTRANVDAALNAGWHAVHWNGSESLSTILQRYIGHFKAICG